MRKLAAFLIASMIFVGCQSNTTEGEVSNIYYKGFPIGQDADSVATEVDSTLVDTSVVSDTTLLDSAQ